MKITKKVAVIIARLILGGLFVAFGLNDLLSYFGSSFFTPPPPEGALAQEFLGSISKTFILPSIKVFEIIGGAMVLTGIFPALGVVMVAPIVFSIFMYHVTLDPGGMPVAIAMLLSQLVLTWACWNNIKPLLEVKLSGIMPSLMGKIGRTS